MKRFVLLTALFALGLAAASFAVAKPPPGKGSNPSTSTSTTTANPGTCRPKISMILKGDFLSGGGSSFSMDVKHSNFHGRSLVGKPLTLMVDDKTSFKRNGPAKLSDFKPRDRLNVQARACKAKKGSTPSTSPPTLLAKRVTGHPAKTGDGSTTTTTTTTP
jgi:hypothetical protein